MASDWLVFRLVTATIASMACFIFAGLLFLRGTDRPASRLFAFSNLFLGLWNISDLAVAWAPTPHLALFLDRLSYVWAILLVFVFFRFITVVIGKSFFNSFIVTIHKSLAGFLVLFSFSPYLIRDVITSPDIVEIPGPLFVVFAIYFLFTLIFALFGFYRSWQRAEGIRRNQLKYLALGVFSGFLAGLFYLFSIARPGFPPIHFLIETVYVALIPITILKIRLMEINLAFRLLMVYLILGFLLGIPISIFVWVITGNIMAATFSLILPSAGYFFFQRMKGKIMDLVDRLPLFRGKYESYQVLEKMVRQIAQSGSSKEWADRLVAVSQEIMRVESCFVLFREEGEDAFIVKASYGIDGARKVFLSVPGEGVLAGMGISKGIILKEMIGQEMSSQSKEILDEMDFLGVSVIAPISYRERVQAFLCLGKKIGRDMYHDIDLTGLLGLAKSAELALSVLLSGGKHEKLSAAWAHDLLKPLGPKGAFHHVESLLSGKWGTLSPPAFETLSKVKEELNFVYTNLMHVVNANSPISIQQKTMNIEGVYKRVGLRYSEQAKEAGIIWVVSKVPDNVLVNGDALLIERRVLGNLIENALRHTPKGGSVTVGYRVEGNTFIGFVQDTGPGIKKEDLSALFTPGVQLDPKNKGQAGLGLASVKSVIEAHGGRVWVESEVGKGTTFFFSL